jgi:sterol desaturase/sphingolipid hydroxylase (fatty acid hydroxylase superfamily)
VSDWLFVKLARHQLKDYWDLQLSSVAFFWLCAIEMVVRRRFTRLAPERVTDMFYWVLMPQVRIASRMVAIALVLGLAVVFGVRHEAAYLEGFGPVARQPKVLIIAELLVLMDLATYWTHRMFHTVPGLWRYHALHHSAHQVTWSTTGRVHPLNELANFLATVVPFALVGFPISVVLPVAPFVIMFAICAHAEWNTAYGPFAKILVSPRFHRWHHTHSHEGGNKNFANVFAIWDRLFGTYYLPADRLPQRFGLDVDDVPQGYLGQFLYPWRKAAVAAPRAVDAPRELAGQAILGQGSDAP